MAIQSVVVSKSVAKSRSRAASIARRVTGKRPRTSRETGTSYRFRQFPPDECVKGSYATVSRGRGVRLVTCKRRK